MSQISYYDIAENEYKYLMLDDLNLIEYYNPVAYLCQQIVEKYLKFLLDDFCLDTNNLDLLRSHKLNKILNRLKESGLLNNVEELDMRFLSDFYYDARYPGVDFSFVSKEEANRAMNIVRQIKIEVNAIVDSNSADSISEVKDMKSFD